MMKSHQSTRRPTTAGEPQQDSGARRCDCPGCEAEGLYRAPVSRDRLDCFYWFCLEHVRAYNLAWNYYKDMSETEIELHRRNDAVWRRPSWPFGRAPGWGGEGTFRDDFGFFGGEGANPARRQAVTEREKALETLGLDFNATFTDAKRRYKDLVKRLHPDANGGDSAAEELLKGVNQAFAVLKAAFAQ